MELPPTLTKELLLLLWLQSITWLESDSILEFKNLSFTCFFPLKKLYSIQTITWRGLDSGHQLRNKVPGRILTQVLEIKDSIRVFKWIELTHATRVTPR